MINRAKIIFGVLTRAGMSAVGAAAMLGNMQLESLLLANNAQNGMSQYTDEQYTKFVDLGTYANFATDSIGYGLCQWTFPSRKAALLRYAKGTGRSIGDITMQAEFCVKELKEDYASLWAYLQGTADLQTAVSRICKEYERPAVNNIADRLKAAESWLGAFRNSVEAPPPEAQYWPPRTIDQGMSGADVAVWQAVMIARGYECEITGEFDYNTLLATLKFQRESGLVDDGIPGPLSWAEALRR